MTRPYGRKGFTTKKAVRRLIEPHEVAGRAGKRQVPIEHLPVAVAAELLSQLPEAQHNERARVGAPSFAQLVQLGLTIPGAEFAGYRVRPEYDHERITLTRLVIPNEALDHEAVQKLAQGVKDPSVIRVGRDGSVFASWASR